MPIYEFRCAGCGHVFSRLYQRAHASRQVSAPPCPECTGTQTWRLVSSFAVHGAAGRDTQEATAARDKEQRLDSITPPGEQIDRWQNGKG